jgi:hypothetical protein
VVIRGGAEVDRLVGAAPPDRLQAWLAPHLAAAGDIGADDLERQAAR